MKEKVSAFIKKHNLLQPHTKVVVGVSGGMDSVALLHLLLGMKNQWGLTIVCVHVDHMFRGKQSEEDLFFVKNLCEVWGIPFEATQVNVFGYKQEKGISSQVAARECRFQFFQDIMLKYNADYLALAHHGDDQVETMLMRFSRGALSKGYAGILPSRPFANGTLIRPFLCVSKEEIEYYIHTNELQYRMDPSNNEDNYTRNRIRHHVLPSLKAEYPNVHEKFQTFSERLTEDEIYLQELTKEHMNKVMKSKEVDSIVIHRKKFCSMAKPLQRRGIQLILNYLYNYEIPPTLSSIHINNLLSLLASVHPSGVLDFPNGLKVIRSYDECKFTFEMERHEAYSLTATVPGINVIPSKGEVVCEILGEYKKSIPLHPHETFLELSAIASPIIIRSRIIGDRVKLKGMDGSKKVKNIFIDQKIPLVERDQWPIITDSKGEILWIPQLARTVYEANEDSVGPVLHITWKSSRSLGGQ